MKNKRRMIGIATAAILALVGTLSLVAYVRSTTDDAVAQEALVDVYVVDEVIPKGAEPGAIVSSISVEQVPQRLLQEGAITELDAIGERVAAADLQPGDQLLDARLAAKAEVFEEVTDKVQVSALLDAERAAGGAIQRGDLVGVYLSFDPFELDAAGRQDEAEATGEVAAVQAAEDPESPSDASTGDDVDAGPERTPNVTRLEFQHVLVTNVQTVNAPATQSDDEDDDGPSEVDSLQYVVTLALSPEQSERFVFATEFGHVWLSIDPSSVTDDGTRTVTLGNVYQPEVQS